MPTHIRVDQEKLHKFCHENGIRRLALFGSVLHEHFEPDSDVDILVEFEADVRIGYIGFAGLQIQLGELLERPVHFNTLQMIDRRLQSQILCETGIPYSPRMLRSASKRKRCITGKVAHRWRLASYHRCIYLCMPQHRVQQPPVTFRIITHGLILARHPIEFDYPSAVMDSGPENT